MLCLFNTLRRLCSKPHCLHLLNALLSQQWRHWALQAKHPVSRFLQKEGLLMITGFGTEINLQHRFLIYFEGTPDVTLHREEISTSYLHNTHFFVMSTFVSFSTPFLAVHTSCIAGSAAFFCFSTSGFFTSFSHGAVSSGGTGLGEKSKLFTTGLAQTTVDLNCFCSEPTPHIQKNVIRVQYFFK